jgi:aspartyl-tRNA(Asn)/glutamyl-tRNA(Gln) amidotransferase subunit C
MKFGIEETARVAALARLRLDDDKLAEFAGQLEDILSYMEELNTLDTREIEPLYSPVELSSPMREDAVHKAHTRDEVLSNAPESDGAFFIVPKIV